ncbi:MAG: DUF3769 domain-containing protein [Synechococcus sp.]
MRNFHSLREKRNSVDWRDQPLAHPSSSKVSLTPEGWTADRMGFTNDPFTPAQTRIDSDGKC